jgi:hypothetical protein
MCVLVHVGEEQDFHEAFLAECCPSLPSICYTGGSASDDLIAQCRRLEIHVVYPEQILEEPRESVIEEVVRWVHQVEASGTDRDGIRQACQSVERFDPRCENAIGLLNAVLRGDEEEIGALKAQLGVTRECTKENLKDLRNDLFPEY